MNEEIETYLSISPNKFGIYLLETKSLKNLYNDELFFNHKKHEINIIILKEFLDKNIFKIEKLAKKFIENIFEINKNKNILQVNLGIKKKNYHEFIKKKYIENSLTEARDLFIENYHNQTILHMLINRYLIDGKSYLTIENEFKTDHLSLEIQFNSIPNDIIYDFNKVLEDYQIRIIKYLDGKYIKNYFNKYKNIEISEMSHKILNGHNKNEVIIVPKSVKKSAFFEKFFQLFS